jgi:CheY-like chemotaxis protein
VDDLPDPDPELAGLLIATGREVDLIYQTMVQVRWSALGSGAASGARQPDGHPVSPQRGGAREPRRPTVFVVDGNPASLQALSHLFQKMNYRVEAFSSVRQYLARQPAAYPACIVASLPSRDQDGPELHPHLVETDGRYPVIFLAGQGNQEEAVRALKSGAAKYLPDTCDHGDLLEAVKRALQGDLNRRNP